MSAPQGGRPVLSTANGRGKHLQDKQSTHYLREQQDASLHKHHAATRQKHHSKTPGQHLAAEFVTSQMGNVVYLKVAQSYILTNDI